MRKTIQNMFIIILLALALSSCDAKSIEYYRNQAKEFSPQQVIEYYIETWNEKNFGKMNVVLSDGMKAITFDYESVQEAKIISIESSAVTELPNTVTNLYEVKVYQVTLGIKRKIGNTFKNEEQTTNYYVGKEMESSPWLIYDETEAK